MANATRELQATGKTISFPVEWEEGAIYRVLGVIDGQAVFERLADYHVSLNMIAPLRSLNGRVCIDAEQRRCIVDGEVVRLTVKEWECLGTLIAHGDKPAPSKSILLHAWGPEYVSDLQYLRVWMSRIRQKIGAEHIELIHNYGYQLVGFENTPVLAAVHPVAAEDASPRAGQLRQLGGGINDTTSGESAGNK